MYEGGQGGVISFKDVVKDRMCAGGVGPIPKNSFLMTDVIKTQ